MKTTIGPGPALFLFVVFFIAFPSNALSEVIFVPDYYPTIQIAINSPITLSGDTIIVRAGTYRENIDFLGKAITVKSEHGPDVTEINGSAVYNTVTFNHGEGRGSVLDGFTISNGIRGIYCHDAGPVIINNVVRNNNECGIYCDLWAVQEAPLIEGNTIQNNTGGLYGGGIYCDNSRPVASIVIRNNNIIGNVAKWGGGIYWESDHYSSGPEITGNLVFSNHAVDSGASGGGICLEGEGSPTVSGNWILENTSARWGGGIYVQTSSPLITNNIISGNSAGSGGGIYSICSFLEPYAPTITANEISENRGFDNGIDGGKGAGIYCVGKGHHNIFGNTIRGNRADSHGGGILFHNSAQGRIEGNLVVENEAQVGAGIVVKSANPFIGCNTIAGNKASLSAGGAAFAESSPCVITGCICWGNTAPASPDIYSDGSCALTVSYCDVGVAVPGQGNISADPLFADPGSGDYHLTFNSPCRNTGSGSGIFFSEDFEGDPRNLSGTIDIGADEYYTHLYMVGSVFPGGNATVKVVGFPGKTPVLLNLGYSVLDPPWPTQQGDLWIEMPPAATVNLGVIPADGILSIPVVIPQAWTAGKSFPFQALVGRWGAAGSKLSNLMILEVK